MEWYAKHVMETYSSKFQFKLMKSLTSTEVIPAYIERKG